MLTGIGSVHFVLFIMIFKLKLDSLLSYYFFIDFNWLSWAM